MRLPSPLRAGRPRHGPPAASPARRAASALRGAASALALLYAAVPAFAQTGLEAYEREVTAAARKALRSAVRIRGRVAAESEGRRREVRPARELHLSGVILTAEGHVVTFGAGLERCAEIDVVLPDERVLRARLQAYDPETDLAVLHAPAAGLVPAEAGDSDALEVGSVLITVGHPFGLGPTFGTGCVSGRRRPIRSGGTMPFNALQTNADVNPGDTGGFVGNARGQFVGLVLSTFRRTPSPEDFQRFLAHTRPESAGAPGAGGGGPGGGPEGAAGAEDELTPDRLVEQLLRDLLGGKAPGGAPEESLDRLWERLIREAEARRREREETARATFMSAQGLNFAMPGNLVRRVAFDLIAHGRVRRGSLGLGVLAEPAALGLTRLVVAEVEADGPAAQAGFQRGDVLEAVDGLPLRQLADLSEELLMAEPGRVLHLRVRRGQGEAARELVLDSALAFPPAPAPPAQAERK